MQVLTPKIKKRFCLFGSLKNGKQETDPRFYNVNSKIGVQSGQVYMKRATFKI